MCAEGRNAMVESLGVSGSTVRSHVDVGGESGVGYQAHFRFAGGAGGEIENRGIFRVHFRADLLECLRGLSSARRALRLAVARA